MKISKKVFLGKLLLLAKIFGTILTIVLPFLYLYQRGEAKRKEEKVILVNEISELKSRLEKLEITPTATLTPTAALTSKLSDNQPQLPKYKFNNKQYELFTSNVTYGNNSSMFFVEFDSALKNISITPFILGYAFTCEVVKGNETTTFVAMGSVSLEKGLPPSESLQERVKLIILGSYYDKEGRLLKPSSDLRVRKCEVRPKTPLTGNRPTLTSLGSITNGGNNVEPKTVVFQ